MKTLLLTGTIRPFAVVRHSDAKRRLSEYVSTIEKYIQKTNFEGVVFAENSGYDCEPEIMQLSQIANNLKKNFEYIKCCEYVDKRNMSTGEASCMREALIKSSLLKATNYVWKSTGRVFVQNSDRITKDNTNNYFLYSRKYNSIQTYFFGCKKDILFRMLEKPVLDDISKDCIEYAWMRYYLHNRSEFSISRFCAFPDAIGINSSGGLYTMSRFKYLERSLMLLLGWYTVK